MKIPGYDNVYSRFYDSCKTSLASSAGFVSQLKNPAGLIARDRTVYGSYSKRRNMKW